MLFRFLECVHLCRGQRIISVITVFYLETRSLFSLLTSFTTLAALEPSETLLSPITLCEYHNYFCILCCMRSGDLTWVLTLVQ